MRHIGYAWVLSLCLLHGTAFAQTAPTDEPQPIRIGQFLFSGYIQYDFLTENRATEASQFDMRRLRFQLTGPITRGVRFLVSAETTGSPVLRDGYVTLDYLPAFTVSVGQMIMPFGYERSVASSNTLEFTERLLELVPSRDAGLMVTNTRPFGGWLTYAAALANGTGMNTSDNNDAKDGILRLTATPPKLPGFHLAVNGARGDQPDGMRTRMGGDIGYERRKYRVMAEFLRERTQDGAVQRDGYYAFGSYRIYPPSVVKGFDHLELAARYGGMHGGDVAGTRQADLAANYYLSRNCRFMFDVILPDDPLPSANGVAFHARANVRF